MAFENRFTPGCACCFKCDVCITTGSAAHCDCPSCGLAPTSYFALKFQKTAVSLPNNPFSNAGRNYLLVSSAVNATAAYYIANGSLHLTAYDPGGCVWNSQLGLISYEAYYYSPSGFSSTGFIALTLQSNSSAVFYFLEFSEPAGTVKLRYVDTTVDGVQNRPNPLTEIPTWREIAAPSDCKCSRKFKFDTSLDYDTVFAGITADTRPNIKFCLEAVAARCRCAYRSDGVVADVTKACNLCNKYVPVNIGGSDAGGCEFLGDTVNAFNNASGIYGGDGCRMSGTAIYGYFPYNVSTIAYKSLSASIVGPGYFSWYSTIQPPAGSSYLYYLYLSSQTIKSTCYALYGMPFDGICDLDDNPINLTAGTLVASRCDTCAGRAIYDYYYVNYYNYDFNNFYSPFGQDISACVACNSVPSSVTLGSAAPSCGVTNANVRDELPFTPPTGGYGVSCPSVAWASGDNTDPTSLGIDVGFTVLSVASYTSSEVRTGSSYTSACNGITYEGNKTPVATIYVSFSAINAPRCEYGVIATVVSVTKQYVINSLGTSGYYDRVRIDAQALYISDGLSGGDPSSTDFTFCAIRQYSAAISYNGSPYQNLFGPGSVLPTPDFPASLTVFDDVQTVITSNDGTITYSQCGEWLTTYSVSIPAITYDGDYINCGWSGCSGYDCQGTTTAETLTLELKGTPPWGTYSSAPSCTAPCPSGIPTDLAGTAGTEANPAASAYLHVSNTGGARLLIAVWTIPCSIDPWYYGGPRRLSITATYRCVNFQKGVGGTFYMDQTNNSWYFLCGSWPPSIAVTG